jgi:gluconolactonase
MRQLVLLLLALLAPAAPAIAADPSASAGTVTARDPAFRRIVPDGQIPRVVADGVTWAEGPIWVPHGGYLLFSDPPANRMYRWAPGEPAATVFVQPSGGASSKGFREAGSNGLKLAGQGRLLFADEGDRGIALMDLRTRTKRLLVQRYQGKRLNSPNDVVVGPDHAIWFTDPPYGLQGVDDSPMKEQPANRVYRLGPDGRLTAVEAQLRYPNGIAFSPDGRTLYVSNSDPKNAVIVAWDVSSSGKLSRRRVFADMNGGAAKGLPGLPDGMTIDERGDLWASGPGGIHVIAPSGRELGLISTGVAISNAAFGGIDGRTVFMTSTHKVVALRTNVRGGPTRLPIIPKTRVMAR